jgi:hypothetical protein
MRNNPPNPTIKPTYRDLILARVYREILIWHVPSEKNAKSATSDLGEIPETDSADSAPTQKVDAC